MRSQEEIKKKVPFVMDMGHHTYGSRITIGTHEGSVVWSTAECGGWEHVSFSPFFKKYIPHWKDMCELKDFFWPDEEECIQIFPKKSEYVNLVENCLHIWRNPNQELPDK